MEKGDLGSPSDEQWSRRHVRLGGCDISNIRADHTTVVCLALCLGSALMRFSDGLEPMEPIFNAGRLIDRSDLNITVAADHGLSLCAKRYMRRLVHCVRPIPRKYTFSVESLKRTRSVYAINLENLPGKPSSRDQFLYSLIRHSLQFMMSRQFSPYLLLIAAFYSCVVSAQVAADIVRSDNYVINRCGASQGPRSKAATLQRLLPALAKQLEKTIADAEKGPNSEYGFEAFFKSFDAIDRVQQVFRAIVAGGDVAVGGGATAPPTLICLTPDDPLASIREGYQVVCVREGGRGPSAGHARGTQWVGICPSFYDEVIGARRRNCPQLQGNGQLPNNDVLQHNQMAILTHELAHLYGVPGDVDIYLIQSCIDLEEAESLDNPSNYALYNAGESPKIYISILSIVVRKDLFEWTENGGKHRLMIS